MKCKCGYEGWAEMGDFPLERFEGKYRDHIVHFRCPVCKTNKDVEYIDQFDSFRIHLYFEKDIQITGRGTLAENLVFWGAGHGEGSFGTTITYSEYERIRKEDLEKYHLWLDELPAPTEKEIQSAKSFWNSL